MTHTTTYRTLEDPSELIVAGDEFKPDYVDDTQWRPCDLMIGHRLRDLRNSRVSIRRVIARSPTTTEIAPE